DACDFGSIAHAYLLQNFGITTTDCYTSIRTNYLEGGPSGSQTLTFTEEIPTTDLLSPDGFEFDGFWGFADIAFTAFWYNIEDVIFPDSDPDSHSNSNTDCQKAEYRFLAIGPAGQTFRIKYVTISLMDDGEFRITHDHIDCVGTGY